MVMTGKGTKTVKHNVLNEPHTGMHHMSHGGDEYLTVESTSNSEYKSTGFI